MSWLNRRGEQGEKEKRRGGEARDDGGRASERGQRAYDLLRSIPIPPSLLFSVFHFSSSSPPSMHCVNIVAQSEGGTGRKGEKEGGWGSQRRRRPCFRTRTLNVTRR